MTQLYTKKTNRGFTLIEVIVVIAIIAILSSTILVTLTKTRSLARDSWRKQQLLQLRTALANYYSKNGSYPSTVGLGCPIVNWCGVTSGSGSKTTSGPTGYIPNLAPTYIGVLPVDPSTVDDSVLPGDQKQGILYKSYTTGGISHYKIYIRGTPESKVGTSSIFYDPERPPWPGNPGLQFWQITDKPDLPPASHYNSAGSPLGPNPTADAICAKMDAPPYINKDDWPICW